MKTREAAALESQLLLQLVAAVKALNVSALEVGTTLTLKCPCGKVILPPILVSPNLKDRQRGYLKSQIERHLSYRHDIAKQTIQSALKDAFEAN